MFFFQTVLLIGYLYAYGFDRIPLSFFRKFTAHALLLLSTSFLFSLGDSRIVFQNMDEEPVLRLFVILILLVGLPFFSLSTTSSLLQRWFSRTSHSSAHDPYFLYAASNLGSLIALLSYPFLVEPYLSLSEQSEYWKWGYFLYVFLVVTCGWLVGKHQSLGKLCMVSPTSCDLSNLNWRQRGQWVVLAFVPSLLLLVVTKHLSTDLAAIPLLWIIPLSLYLTTFIVAFLRSVPFPKVFVARMYAFCLIALLLTILTQATEPLFLLMILHVFAFTLAAYLCHGELARRRPASEHLTEFYLWLSLGGVLGGVTYTLILPIIFHRVGEIEYPILLLFVCWLHHPDRSLLQRKDLMWAFLPALVAFLAWLFVTYRSPTVGTFLTHLKEFGLPEIAIRSAILFGLPLFLAAILMDHSKRFILALCLLLLVSALDDGPAGKRLHYERNAFGSLAVTTDAQKQFHRLVHGNTIHGQQRIQWSPRTIGSFLLPLGAQNPLGNLTIRSLAPEIIWIDLAEPLTYYHRTGPASNVFRSWGRTSSVRQVGVVGLGTGSLAWYAQPHQNWLFFELDPAVVRIASDPRYFTYLRDCKARHWNCLLGDARLQLQKLEEQRFDILVLDAFSSDAIPLHLLTQEAIQLYCEHLTPDGILLFHVSNRYLDLAPILGRLAQLTHPPMHAFFMDDSVLSDTERDAGKYPSQWVLFLPTHRQPRWYGLSPFWIPIQIPESTPVWSDDFANLWSAFRGSSDDR